MMSVQGEADYLRRSMLAGAREFLVKPFSSDELTRLDPPGARPRAPEARAHAGRRPGQRHRRPARLRHEGGSRSSPSSRPRAGSGARRSPSTWRSRWRASSARCVTLVDGSFQFGDVGVLLNLNPKNKSIIDVVADSSTTDDDLVDTTLINHSTGIKVLLAPPSPEMAELITVEHIRRMMGRLRDTNDFVVVDLWPHFNDVTLALLDMSDVILTSSRSRSRTSRTSGSSSRSPSSSATRTACASCSTAPTPPSASASRMWRTRWAARSTTRSSPTDAPSSTRSTAACPFVWSNSQAPVSEDILKISRALVNDEAVRQCPGWGTTGPTEVHLRAALTMPDDPATREMPTCRC